MRYLLDSKGMKEIDRISIDNFKIPALVLMERASLSVAKVILKNINSKDKILAVCGMGNNGGDAIATARILTDMGYKTDILLLGDENSLSNESKIQLEIAKKMELSILINTNIKEYNIIIDGIFGIGLTRNVEGKFAEIINQINESENTVYSVDIPSGICADSGKIMNYAIIADYTITFGYEKIGLTLFPGISNAGKIIIEDIGFPKKILKKAPFNTFTYTPEDLNLIPKRKDYSNKGTYGNVLIIAGSNNMSGACYLSAKAALMTGCGLVKIITAW